MNRTKKPIGSGKRGKIAIVASLYAGAVLISASGAFFTVYSILCNVSFRILNAGVPGFFLGLLVAYFGIRYLLLVKKLSNEILKDSSYFSWSNFRRAKTAKSR